jgi:ribonucleotide monophosphatase NagD (HAD superfamily)
VRAPERLFDGYVFDLDGTVYLGDELLPEARETLEELKGLSSVVYLPEEALASTDRLDYVIEHLVELLPASETHRPKAWNSEGRGD